MTITRVRESYYAGWKVSGAVTYVLVSDSMRGYGIFIEHMLDAAE